MELFFFATGSTTSPTHSASYPKGTAGSFPKIKRPGREAAHSPPSSAEVKNLRNCISPTPIHLPGVVLS